MKEKIIITLVVCLVLVGISIILKPQKDYKYSIVNSGGLTILLDKESGLAWRNCFCDNKERIPHCWALMEYSGAIVPDGEQYRRDEKLEYELKTAGLK